MFVNTLPIYWGTNKVKNDFNPKSFVYVNDFENYEKAIDHIKNIYEDKQLYKEILAQPWFHENKIPDRFQPASILNFLEDIL